MPGAAGAADHAMEQALLAQLPPHTYLDAWRCRNAPAVTAPAPSACSGNHGRRSAFTCPG